MQESIKNLPHYEISSRELAAWLRRQGDVWWTVDGDPVLTGILTFPSPGDELASALDSLNRPLLVQDRRKEPRGKGERIEASGLGDLVTTLGNNIHTNGGTTPTWSRDRLLFLSWKDVEWDWMLVEDSDTTESYRTEAATAGKR